LLRNGLDYLNYQQYDRALKFLREAETRQKELNDAEKLALKQGIERAQRGLREASDAESPYALSERSRPRPGFKPAKPESKVASSTDPLNPPARLDRTNRSTPTNLMASDGEDQGEPIRLASGEAASSDTAPPPSNASSRSMKSTTMAPHSGQPASLPEIPKLPSVSQLGPADASVMPNQRGPVVDPGAAGVEPGATQENVIPRRLAAGAEVSQVPVSTPLAEPTVEPRNDQTPDKEIILSPVPTGETPAPNMAAMIPAPAPLATPVPSSSGLAQPTAASPTTKAVPNPTVIDLETISLPAPTSGAAQPTAAGGLAHKESEDATPVSMPNPAPVTAPAPSSGTDEPTTAVGLAHKESEEVTPASTPNPAPATVPVPSSGTAQPTTTGGLAHKESEDATPVSMPNPAPVTAPAPASDTDQPTAAGGLAHKESEDATLVSMPNPALAPAPAPTAPLTPAPAAPDPANELPPLPPELGRPSTPNPAQDASPQPTATLTPLPAALDSANELPPLPPELGGTSTPNAAHDASPPQAAALTPVPAAPDAANELPPLPPDLGRTSTPSPAQGASPPPTATLAPAPAAPDVANPPRSPAVNSHTEEESLPPLPGGNEAASTTTAAPGEGHNVEAGTAVAPPQSPGLSVSDMSGPSLTGGSGPGSTPADVNPPVGPALGVAVAAPAAQPSPTTNPNPERQGVATTATGVEAAPEPTSLPPAIKDRTPSAPSADSFIPERRTSPSTLRPELQREVEIIARNQEDELRRQVQNPTQPVDIPRDTNASDLRTQTQLDISRAPSPAEARPIRAIPVPEDWVALPPRAWAPQRKYWAAAATCHLPLYFQDPVLERYGHSVENFVGPMGRFLTYPVDDPTQSTQRNQILQPFFSAGLFALQIAAWPYNIIVDPPWEAQYDLGYYRPGDNIPTDTYWLPLHGYGPPLRGSNY